ncbi:MAG: hypothetical protein LBF04_06895 [Prevotellaceae bacterium]|nr:hypothetical protein [Prevotellaceae bacterium]
MAYKKISKLKRQAAENMLHTGRTWREISLTTGISMRNIAIMSKKIKENETEALNMIEEMKTTDYKGIQLIMKDRLIEIISNMEDDISRIKAIEKKVKVLETLTKICLNINEISDDRDAKPANNYFNQFIKNLKNEKDES